MATENWLIRKGHDGGIVEIGLNNGPVNALNPAFLMDFAELIDDLGTDDAVRAIVITSPFKVFSAGLDLKEMQHFDLEQQNVLLKALTIGFLQLFACPKPTIAAVNGAVIAGGLFIALSCDFRVSSPNATVGLAEVRVGADFPLAALEIARATLDLNSLRRLMLSGQPIGAEAARAAGIIDEISADGDVVDLAMKIARQLTENPPLTYASIKRQIRGSTIALLREALETGSYAPEGGWFNEETHAAIKRMIG
ncbi:MAG: enoyl-CoA hydratase/isomerase family protein [Gammaproteobacteria bacterium]|nr:MAG: enoyl-CoA hydratase/isomerase family protein [Gammaproteobacteria bacterium]